MSELAELEKKMQSGGCTAAQIRRFKKKVLDFIEGRSKPIPETAIQAVDSVPRLDQLEFAPELLSRTVILKLNGGLGTSMGLTGPKGLLTVKQGMDFYHILLRQLENFERKDGFRPPLMFMNSFSTQEQTEARLRQLGFEQELPWGFLQSRVPKILQDGTPAQAAEEFAWCPPGHGDLYPTLLDQGLKERLMEAGYRYLFVSNIDNLGAVLDSRPLGYMASEGLSFLMEVTRRGENDRKGGHLAQDHQGRLLLREVAQCPEDDLPAFQNIDKHRYFNTNNLWIDLEAVEESWTELPTIINRKPVIPQQPDSQRVVQLESAMGAAIGVAENTGALEVERDRFFPVKTTNDLLLVRSDLYALGQDGRLSREVPRSTIVNLDPEHYKMVSDFESLVEGVPSLKKCSRLTVRGPVVFRQEDRLEGEVNLENSGDDRVTAASLL